MTWNEVGVVTVMVTTILLRLSSNFAHFCRAFHYGDHYTSSMARKLLSIPLRELADMEIVCPECHTSFVLNAARKLKVRLPCPMCGVDEKTGLGDMYRLFNQYSEFFRDAKDSEISFLVEIIKGE